MSNFPISLSNTLKLNVWYKIWICKFHAEFNFYSRLGCRRGKWKKEKNFDQLKLIQQMNGAGWKTCSVKRKMQIGEEVEAACNIVNCMDSKNIWKWNKHERMLDYGSHFSLLMWIVFFPRLIQDYSSCKFFRSFFSSSSKKSSSVELRFFLMRGEMDLIWRKIKSSVRMIWIGSKCMYAWKSFKNF